MTRARDSLAPLRRLSDDKPAEEMMGEAPGDVL